MLNRIIDTLNNTNIYILYDEINKKAIVIDPCNFYEVDRFIINNCLDLEYIVLTHEHFDHTLGVNDLCSKYKCKIIASETCSKLLIDSKTNLSNYAEVLLFFANKQNKMKKVHPFICKQADITFCGIKQLKINGYIIKLVETPGHSKGSISIIVNNSIIFTGDSLFKDMDVITRFPGGSTKDYKSITIPFYKSLSGDLIVYPGHGESFILKGKVLVEENK